MRRQTLDNSRRLSTRRRRWRSTSKEASTRGSRVMWATLIGYRSRGGSTVAKTRVGGNQGLSISNRESEGMLEKCFLSLDKIIEPVSVSGEVMSQGSGHLIRH